MESRITRVVQRNGKDGRDGPVKQPRTLHDSSVVAYRDAEVDMPAKLGFGVLESLGFRAC